jgi:glycosyltransferase involved in cell wall biosynthesis
LDSLILSYFKQSPTTLQQDLLKVLAFVHFRNIVGSTGAGRVARCLVERLCCMPDLDLRVLADQGDYQKTILQAGIPWTELKTYLFSADTSAQQARWLFLQKPAAESYWQSPQITYCTAESYVPVLRSKLVVTLHDAAHLENGVLRSNVKLWKQRVKWNILYRVLDKKADAFHTVSQFSAERLAHYWPGIHNRLHVIPNGVADCFLSKSRVDPAAVLARLGLANTRFVLLPCGLQYRKNADLILKAWPLVREKHKDLKLVTTNSSEAEYSALAKTMGGSILQVGHVSDADLRALYQSAETVWFPSLYEGFGMPVLEAMACGAAVLTSNGTAIAEVAGDAALLVQPRDLKAQVDALLWLVEDRKTAAMYGRRGALHATNYTWKRSAQMLRTLFGNLAAN